MRRHHDQNRPSSRGWPLIWYGSIFLSCLQCSCGGLPGPDGQVTDWGERDFLVVTGDGSGRLWPEQIPTSSEARFAVEWSIATFSPPDIWLLSAGLGNIIADLGSRRDLCDLRDARALEYSDYSLGRAFMEDGVVVLFNPSLDAHLAVVIDDIAPTGATPDEYFMGTPIATVDASWYIQADGSGDFSKLCR